MHSWHTCQYPWLTPVNFKMCFWGCLSWLPVWPLFWASYTTLWWIHFFSIKERCIQRKKTSPKEKFQNFWTLLQTDSKSIFINKTPETFLAFFPQKRILNRCFEMHSKCVPIPFWNQTNNKHQNFKEINSDCPFQKQLAI